MRSFERLAISVRRSDALRRADGLWNGLRPYYMKVLAKVASGGLERHINGTDRILIDPGLYSMPETYEPEVWPHIMAALRSGDVVADVGASLGLYTLAIAKRIGPQGYVYAFEPDLESVGWLRRNVHLNHLEDSVRVVATVVDEESKTVGFVDGRGSESHVLRSSSEDGVRSVDAITLDEVFANSRLDILKIDVEGYEEAVLRGGRHLLSDATRAPRAIFIEVHPFAWSTFNFSSKTLLDLLTGFGYVIFDLQGNSVADVKDYGEIVAYQSVEMTGRAMAS